MRSGYAVIVTKDGEPILTIEREMYCGLGELSDEDADAIRDASEHLAAFIGPPRVPCGLCGGSSCKCPESDNPF